MPSQTAPTIDTSAGYWSMGAAAVTAVINTVGQIWTGEIYADIQSEQYSTQGKIADIMQGMAMAAFNAEEQKMSAVKAITGLKSKGSLAKTEAEAKLKIVRQSRIEQNRTRDFRRSHFYGHPHRFNS